MALNEIQQLQKIVENSKYILLLLNSRDNGDAIAASLALKMFFEKQHKQADIVCNDFIAPKTMQFLQGINSIKKTPTNLQKFIIKVDVSKNPLESLSYDIKNSTLHIYLTPKEGLITKNELRTAQSTFKYDLIVTLNTPDLESLGPIFKSNTDLFYKTVIANIDHFANNERYGQVNLIDLSAASTSELVYKFIKETDESLLDKNIATTILTGMTIATAGFKNQNISPNTLHLASELMGRGGDREKIIQNLYRTRSISTLRLWGEALTHLQSDPKTGLVWTTISREDFSRSGSSPDDLKGIIEELLGNSPDAKIILIFYEIENGVEKSLPAGRQVGCFVAADKNYDAVQLVHTLEPEGNKHLAHFSVVGKSLKEAEDLVLKVITEALPTTN